MTMDTVIKLEQPEDISDLKPKAPSNEKDLRDHLTDNGGLYDLIVKQMIQQGHEGELCSWLKESNLIRSNMNCPTEGCNGKSLQWSPARSIDKYSWVCFDCKKRQNLRDSSFFLQIKCDLKICMQLIVAWCQSIPSDVVINHLNVKPHVVKRAYEKLGKVTETYVIKHAKDWVLGGGEKILIVDEFPGGYMAETVSTPVPKKRNNNCRTILCIAECHNLPPRMWMHIINANPEPPKNAKNQTTTRCGMVEEALNEIRAHAVPGSFLIANKRARCCNYEALKELQEYTVLCIEDLQTYDTPGKNELLANLETIWQTGIGVCEEIQDSTRSNGLSSLYEHLWKQKFATTPSNAFTHIIHHIAECHPLT
ncbi:uncharacterized protein LOC100680094 isoform X1 [Nasonia vitripennis]|uniref:Uncharacterized protein n=2 Tax=Nasonia vitripennis TaxID=7425 RepID=A0A7M7GF61_NASVI|nr:uncharacterized protein LOC100680094 isoform X1 [Nasonia vitripennis]